MASRLPVSSWTARSWLTSRCAMPTHSDVLPKPPARRRLPDRPVDRRTSRALLLRDRRPFFIHDTNHFTTEPQDQGAAQVATLARSHAHRPVPGRGGGPDRG